MKYEILKRIDVLADKLGVAANYIFHLYVQQARVEAIQDSILLIIGVGLAVLSCIGFKRALSQNIESYFWFSLFGSVLALFLIIIPLFALPTEIFNPEYWAFREILSQLKPAASK